MNSKLTSFLLLGLCCMVTVVCGQQETQANSSDLQLTQPQNVTEDGEFMDFWEGEESDDDYEELSPEELLAEIIEEKQIVTADCIEIQKSIDQAKQNGSEPDHDLEDALDGCHDYLKEIEEDLEDVQKEINNSGKNWVTELSPQINTEWCVR